MMSVEWIYLFRRIMATICCIFGLPGNLLTIIVCFKALYRRTINFESKVFDLYLAEISILGKPVSSSKMSIFAPSSSMIQLSTWSSKLSWKCTRNEEICASEKSPSSFGSLSRVQISLLFIRPRSLVIRRNGMTAEQIDAESSSLQLRSNPLGSTIEEETSFCYTPILSNPLLSDYLGSLIVFDNMRCCILILHDD